MPASKNEAKKRKVSIRDLGAEGARGLGSADLKSVRGGKTGCRHKGSSCGTLHVDPMVKPSKVLTVVVLG